jgi:pyridoxine 5-phosphate synthase
MAKLCVNIDHIATLRQARGGSEPDPVSAAVIAELAGAQGITVHLREDRRHIQDRDVEILRRTVKTKLNLEMSADNAVVEFALKVVPDEATLVPEKRMELTTEGGLDVIKNMRRIKNTVARLKSKGIIVSLFIDPEQEQIRASKVAGADFIELHTGRYANATGEKNVMKEIVNLRSGVKYAEEVGLKVNAGHGLDYLNTRALALTEGIEDFNIGHSIIARASLIGLEKAVREMIGLITV